MIVCRWLLLSSLFVSFSASSSEEIQRRFSEAMQKIERDPGAAVEILNELTNVTDSVRISLELGRALYLSGKLHDARDKFVEVLDKLPADAPPQVRANVEQFLIDINRKLNPLRFSFSVVRDSNPTLSTDTRRVHSLVLILITRPKLKRKRSMDFDLQVISFSRHLRKLSLLVFYLIRNMKLRIIPDL